MADVIISKNNFYSQLNKEQLKQDIFWNLFFDRFEKKFSNEILMKKKILYPNYYAFCGRSFKLRRSRAKKLMLILRDYGYFKINCHGVQVVK